MLLICTKPVPEVVPRSCKSSPKLRKLNLPANATLLDIFINYPPRFSSFLSDFNTSFRQTLRVLPTPSPARALLGKAGTFNCRFRSDCIFWSGMSLILASLRSLLLNCNTRGILNILTLYSFKFCRFFVHYTNMHSTILPLVETCSILAMTRRS